MTMIHDIHDIYPILAVISSPLIWKPMSNYDSNGPEPEAERSQLLNKGTSYNLRPKWDMEP